MPNENMAVYFRHFTSCNHFYGEIIHELSTNLLLTGTGEQAVLFWELFLILGICSQLNILKVPDLNRVEYVGLSRDQLAIARIFVGLASYWTRS